MRRALVVVVTAAVAFGAITLVALEGREVVVLETADARGAPRRTRTWIAEDAGALWVEAAGPERPFLEDLQRTPALVLERHATRLRCTADVQPNPGGHERIRRLLAERYGWADCWIGLVADTSHSFAIRLSCA
ncbi:MAG TPA: hypothetical protein VMS22_15400 [Candidatus Eisenbacteria bacterium]|nr:hypothetical protein [Candidatus Eisenbacteria bacterium]